MMQKDSKILIIGAGGFGTSTAYHLSLRGYNNIVVLDRYGSPSPEAATTDINKIIRSDYSDSLYVRLGIEAISEWKTSNLFQGIYHQPGWILGAKKAAIPFVENSVEINKRLGVQGIEFLTKEQVLQRFPKVTGKFNDWNIFAWNPTAGWASMGEALRRMSVAAQNNGVQYLCGSQGNVERLLFAPNGQCIGAIAEDGTHHHAEKVIVAAGARSPLLLDLKGQIIAKGHGVAHIQLSAEETAKYREMPIFDNTELGYWFPPTEDGLFKLAHSVFIRNTCTNNATGITTSVPHTFLDNPEDGIPVEIETAMRRNLSTVYPELASRSWCYQRLCWDGDTADRHFLITPHPEHQSLFLATGGSAHGAKFLPVIGKYIANMIEGNLEPQIACHWRWRAGQEIEAKDLNLAHPEPEPELKDLTGWKGRNAKLSDNEL